MLGCRHVRGTSSSSSDRPHVTLEGTLLDEVDKGPADAGTAVLRSGHQHAELGHARREVVDADTAGQLAVSPSDHDVARRNESGELGDGRRAGLLARFSRAHPGIDVSLTEGIAADMFRRLAADELDAAFCLLAGEVSDQFAVEHLSEEEAVAAFAPDRAPVAPDDQCVRSEPPGARGATSRLHNHLRPR